MGTITIDVRYLNGLVVDVNAVGVTGHTIVVNDWIHPDETPRAPAGSTVTPTADQHGRRGKKIQTTI